MFFDGMMENEKLNAAMKALEYIKDGMTVGLGSGTTSEIFLNLLAKKHLDILCVPTSVRIATLAKRNGMRTVKFSQELGIDVAVDGADQVDRHLNLIKGYGGAMLMEKLVDYGARKFIVIVDESKVVERLGGRLPIEVNPNKTKAIIGKIRAMESKLELRESMGKTFVTDNGNWIIDCYFNTIDEPVKLDKELKLIDGVLETGIFARGEHTVIVGKKNSAIKMQVGRG